MLRFESTKDVKHLRTRNYFSRQEQYRLLVLVFSLLTVFFLMQEARQPENWHWLWGAERAMEPPSTKPCENNELDTRLADAGLSQRTPGALIIEKDEVGTSPTQVDADALLAGQVNIDMSMIRDNTVFRHSESETWFAILATLRDAPLKDLQTAPADTVGFTQLFQQPDEYRGKLVRVTGNVRRAHFVQAHKNVQGIDGYWQCWLFPTGSKNPLVIYSLQMPDGFPKGMKIAEHVEFVGISYKLWAYQAVKDILTAPLIIAKAGAWQPQAATPPTTLPSRKRVVLAVALVLFGAMGTAMWVFRQSRHLSPKAFTYGELRKLTNSDLSLDELQAGPNPSDFLDNLRQESKKT